MLTEEYRLHFTSVETAPLGGVVFDRNISHRTSFSSRYMYIVNHALSSAFSFTINYTNSNDHPAEYFHKMYI